MINVFVFFFFKMRVEQVLFGCLAVSFVVVGCVHMGILYKLKAFRQRVGQVIRADEAKWQVYEERSLGKLRSDFNMGSGVSGDIAAAQGLLRETSAVLSKSVGALEKFSNETKEFYGWLSNHMTLSHGNEGSVTVPKVTKICLPISVTTRGTKWTRLQDTLLLTSFFPSLVRTAEPGYHYGVYLGYDDGDPLLDSEDGQRTLRQLVAELTATAPVTMKAFRYSDSRNRNVWAVNYVTRECYMDGYDYFYRVNDDSAFEEPWTERLVQRLQQKQDFGVVGTLDKENPRIFTHSLVGRPHLEVFGYYFPFEFGNYWSDDWITFVYQPPYMIKSYDVPIKHHKHAERYTVEWNRKTLLDEMVNLGRKRWKAYLCLQKKMHEYCTETTQKDFGNEW